MMNIKVLGHISIVSTKSVPYFYKRKGYYVGSRYVKPKKIRKYKDVLLKKPYLVGNIDLIVDELIRIGTHCRDEHNNCYVCVSSLNITAPESGLRIISTNLSIPFKFPTEIRQVALSFNA